MSGAKPRRVHIIGIGSPSGEDRLGWQAVELLEQRSFRPEQPTLALRFFPQVFPGPPLFAALRGADLAILIDAMLSDAEPGTVREVGMHEIAGRLMPISSHGLDLPQCLELAEVMDEPPQSVRVIGIEAGGGLDLANVSTLIERLCGELLSDEVGEGEIASNQKGGGKDCQ